MIRALGQPTDVSVSELALPRDPDPLVADAQRLEAQSLMPRAWKPGALKPGALMDDEHRA